MRVHVFPSRKLIIALAKGTAIVAKVLAVKGVVRAATIAVA
jgi:hypothetical protein